MIVQLGEQVIGKNAKLGRIVGFRIDPNSQAADQMVVKHGLPFHRGHLTVLGHVTGVEPGVVRIDLTKEKLESLEKYDQSAFHAANMGPGVAPAFDSQGDNRYKHWPTVPYAHGPESVTTPEHSQERVSENHPMPPSYPTESQVAPLDEQPVVIARGTDILDKSGEKIGQVQSFAVETSTGKPTRIAVENGVSGRNGCEIALDRVQHYGSKGIVLNVARNQAGCK